MVTVGFNGLTVAAFESRMAAEIARLIERHGGNPLVTPALREIPLDDNSAALKFGVSSQPSESIFSFFLPASAQPRCSISSKRAIPGRRLWQPSNRRPSLPEDPSRSQPSRHSVSNRR